MGHSSCFCQNDEQGVSEKVTFEQRPKGYGAVRETCVHLEEEGPGRGNSMCKAAEQGEDLAGGDPGGQSSWKGGMEKEESQ